MTREVGLELGETIINKPIVANYIPVSEPNTSTDNFTGHEATITKDKYGRETVSLGTVPLGVFTSKGYIITINENGNDKEVLVADAILWRTRYSDACDLLVEWYSRGIKINTSCEFLYNNYTVVDKVEYINSPVYFEGHCILASENRGNQNIILPAYDSSKLLSLNEIEKFNRLVAQAQISNYNPMEGEEMKYKKLFELSHDDIRSKIYQKLDPTLPEDNWSWIVEVYDDHFIVEIEGSEYKIYDYKYQKSDDDVTIDFDSKTEVVEKREWVQVNNELEIKLNSATQKAADYEASLEQNQLELNALKDQVEKLTTEKESLETKFNEAERSVNMLNEEKTVLSANLNKATEKISELTGEVNSLQTFKEQLNQIKFDQNLQEQTNYFRAKFSAISPAALQKFEEEEVQELLTTVAKEDQESESARIKLNSLLVDLVEVRNTESNKNFENTYFREMSSKLEDLLPDNEDFDRKYS